MDRCGWVVGTGIDERGKRLLLDCRHCVPDCQLLAVLPLRWFVQGHPQ